MEDTPDSRQTPTAGQTYFNHISPPRCVRTCTAVTTVHPTLPTLIPAGFMGGGPDAGFKPCMTGETGRQYEVYTHTNVLAPFATWEYLSLMSKVNRLFDYLDRGTTNLPYRFYTAKQVL